MKSFLLLQVVLVWTVASANEDEPEYMKTHDNTEFEGYDLQNIKAPDQVYCQMLCSHHSQCTHYCYEEQSFDCHMKHLEHGVTPVSNEKEDVVSGYAIPPGEMDNYQCYEHLFPEMDFPGNDILIFEKETPAECSETCTKYEDCEFFTHNTKTNLCFLKSCTMLPSPPVINVVHGLVSGYSMKDCYPEDMCGTECSDLVVDGYDFPGCEFCNMTQPDADRCQLVCNDLPRCKFFTFISETHPDPSKRFSCSLKAYDTEVPGQMVKKEHHHSGYSLRSVRSHKSCSDEVYDDLDFPGNDQRHVKVKTYDQCRTVCSIDPLCQFWTFVEDDYAQKDLCGYCYLKNVVALPNPPVIRNHDDAVSGFSQKKCFNDESAEDTHPVQEVKGE